MESPQGDTLVIKLGQKYFTADMEKHQTIMTNIYLDEAEYQVLSELGGEQISKRRYPYQFEQQQYSIDVFDGLLAGLVLAEIEGRPGIELSNLPAPGFAHQEVTGDTTFSGFHLAGLEEFDLQNILVEYGVQ